MNPWPGSPGEELKWVGVTEERCGFGAGREASSTRSRCRHPLSVQEAKPTARSVSRGLPSASPRVEAPPACSGLFALVFPPSSRLLLGEHWGAAAVAPVGRPVQRGGDRVWDQPSPPVWFSLVSPARPRTTAINKGEQCQPPPCSRPHLAARPQDAAGCLGKGAPATAERDRPGRVNGAGRGKQDGGEGTREHKREGRASGGEQRQ